MAKQKVVVCGATGSQGKAVVEALLESKRSSSYDVIGLTRNPDSKKCQELVQYYNTKMGKSLTFVQADWLDASSLKKALSGADFVFGVTQPWNDDYSKADVLAEVEQGRNLVQACLDAKIKHLVFSSVWHEDTKTEIPHVDSKIDIEKLIVEQASNLNYTILQPVQFMDNLGLPFFPVAPCGKIQGFVHKDAKMPFVACRDIGKITVHIMDQPSSFVGQKIPLVGDAISGVGIAAEMNQISSGTDNETTFFYSAIPAWLIRLFSKEFYLMRMSFEKNSADPAAMRKVYNYLENCRKLNPDMLDMKAYLKYAKWDEKDLGPKPASLRDQPVKMALLLSAVVAAVSIAVVRKGRANN